MMPPMNDQPGTGPAAEPEPGREEAFFEAALVLPPEQRSTYLQKVCGADVQLRAKLEDLIQSYEGSSGFLEPAATSVGVSRTMVIASPELEKPGDVIGRYKLREKLGEGGCGVVYVAEQTEPVRRRVALKIIKLGMDTRSVIARFEAERQALALMDHPNIAKVLDAGATETGRPYFVMELVRGIKITDYCDQNHLDTPQRLQLFIQVCHAIQHAHQKGVIHRDIKPSNILVTLHDGVPVPKVIDFGIAKATEGRLSDLTVYTELHQFIGTPAYMSPEQAEMSGLDIDTRSDIYSLGVLLYELLTGHTPFDPQELVQAGLDQMRRTIRELEPLRPSTRLSTMLDADLTTVAKRHGAEPPKLIHLIRGDLDWIVMKALEKDRSRRFETANGLATDVQRFLNNEAVEARPPSNLYRFQKLVRRNKTVFAASGAVLIALVFGLGLSLFLFVRQQAALRRAVAAERQEAALRKQAELGLELERRLRAMAPVSDKLGEAGLLLSEGQFGKAEEVMSRLPPLIPASSSIYNVIGGEHARRGQWAGAITNYSRAIEADPSNHLAYHWLAPLLVQAGDLAGYRRLCQLELHRFKDTSDPITAERMAKDCLLLPPPTSDLEPISKWADTAVAAGAGHSYWVYFQLVKGLAEYRLGHFAEALKWLQDVVENQSTPAHTVQAYMLWAMAEYQLKKPEEARSILAKGDKLAETDPGGPWNDRLIAQMLIREAKALISQDSNGNNGTK
jgi:serine/threonine protein kinase/Flp pilus assembly protein TadD